MGIRSTDVRVNLEQELKDKLKEGSPKSDYEWRLIEESLPWAQGNWGKDEDGWGILE